MDSNLNLKKIGVQMYTFVHYVLPSLSFKIIISMNITIYGKEGEEKIHKYCKKLKDNLTDILDEILISVSLQLNQSAEELPGVQAGTEM